MMFVFLGNVPWLDFVNTRVKNGGAEVDLLADIDALTRWGAEAKLLHPEESATVTGNPPDAATGRGVLEKARSLRTGLRKAAEEMIAGGAVSPAFVAEINTVLADHPMAPELQRRADGWAVTPRAAAVGPETVLARVATDFARFLAEGDTTSLRKCARDDCVVLFQDTSKNRTRRWCSMEVCGNRAKAAGRRARGSGKLPTAS